MEWEYLWVRLRMRRDKGLRLRFVVSHISRKTSEMWGTRQFVAGTEFESRVWWSTSWFVVGTEFESGFVYPTPLIFGQDRV